MKTVKPSDHRAKPNTVIQIVATRIIRNEASNDKGAFQYLKSKPAVRKIKHLVGKGQYVGDNNNITAFVWLEDETALLKKA